MCCSTPYCMKEFSICRFAVGRGGGVVEPLPSDAKGQLYLSFWRVKSYTTFSTMWEVGLVPLTSALFKAQMYTVIKSHVNVVSLKISSWTVCTAWMHKTKGDSHLWQDGGWTAQVSSRCSEWRELFISRVFHLIFSNHS